ncbi:MULTISPECIES: hypothetical protein [Pantoea]|uniref:hypothetical protein n=1 Tax=Pantoea TaxID=53335 RepID=UPI000FEC9196|nr:MULTISPECIES: hypothetical protein [Pantoea]MCW0331140.1 hypothetical protein [Pantoea ananatis]MCW0352282.1 hypothetical protein [Pantoea ananatis]MEB6537254.1 hypothetical protein [Pantoea stewartii]QAB29036.1 hypothetical protein EPK90_04115 [Pantoea ananatis]UYL01892.1 hypothetical protein NG830_00550 [Pantoea ananatis]
MERFTNAQLHHIAQWCVERDIIPDRLTRSEVDAACRSLGIRHREHYDLYQLKEISELMKS